MFLQQTDGNIHVDSQRTKVRKPGKKKDKFGETVHDIVIYIS